MWAAKQRIKNSVVDEESKDGYIRAVDFVTLLHLEIANEAAIIGRLLHGDQTVAFADGVGTLER